MPPLIILPALPAGGSLVRNLLTVVGAGLIAASIVLLTSGDASQGPKVGLGLVGGVICLVVGLTLPRRHPHRRRR